jgi:hypothetical protein
MTRNAFGSVIALLGAIAALWSPFRPWYGNRAGQDILISDLFGGITTQTASLWESMFLLMLVGAVLTVVGVLLQSRLLVALGGLVVTGFTILWMVRQGLDLGSLTAGGTTGLGSGAALAFGGGVGILLGALIMSGRAGRRRARHARAEPEPVAGPYGSEGEPSAPDRTEGFGPTTRPMGRPHGVPPAPPPEEPGSPGHRRAS